MSATAQANISPSTLRVRRHRRRHRDGLRLFTIEAPTANIEHAISRGLPKPGGSRQGLVGGPSLLRRSAINPQNDKGFARFHDRKEGCLTSSFQASERFSASQLWNDVC
jgi:hypothetical protein